MSIETETRNDEDKESLTSMLDLVNKDVHKTVLNTKSKVELKRNLRWYVDGNKYFFSKLYTEIHHILADVFHIDKKDIYINLIDRKNFWWDVSIKIDNLIQKEWMKKYMDEYLPKIKECMETSQMFKDWMIESISIKWFYFNIKLKDEVLFQSLKDVLSIWDKYGEVWDNAWKNIVIDYSSPNTAKHLHAWHIRSTIIWHVLGNIYEANGYTVHRTNHINDRWWFGILIEWYKRFLEDLDSTNQKNDILATIYKIYRDCQKMYDNKEEFETNSGNNDTTRKMVWDFDTYDEFRKKYEEFLSRGKSSFQNLEKWKKDEVTIRQKIVKWSMEDFEGFYKTLDTHLDYTIGESFYSDKWKNIVLAQQSKNVVFFSQELADKQIAIVKSNYERWSIDRNMFENIHKEIINDIGSYVIMLAEFERFVVLKWDGSSIYATRDIWAIDYRINTFAPSKIVYVVGQEQQDHFNKLFEFTKKLHPEDQSDFLHIYFGFYVDEKDKKKLSSRQWASNVNNLLNWSIEYFKERYKDNNDFPEEEKNIIAQTLWVWSIIYNDIKKDKKMPILISWDIQKAIKGFEEAWWAYIIYSSCRAKSIIKKIDNKLPNIEDIGNITLEWVEVEIIKKIIQFPEVIKQSCKEHNPSLIAEFLYNMSLTYNTYYANYQVLKWDNPYRLIITKSVAQVLDNGLKILHIKPLERI